ncbi:50S ribosomal protein L34e [Fervidicoccus fontis]|nr:50S ribosomal protein L34e [Fervidicoccus fontis]PMB75710.1 MAG: 50S ribosomal protein L34e [Fervidicoccus fontis]PMB78096.1 MAG: 50S ribosomal protein L34e [Fervidicoccus fontis]HEW64162.1 50S ribosomal protein L34e [Fervidicoccus fontis]
MPRPSQRTNSKAKVKIRTPGGINKIHYKERKRSLHRCMYCGRPLGGTPNGSYVEIKRLSKTKKRPNRIFGGVVCPECLAKIIKNEARKLVATS